MPQDIAKEIDEMGKNLEKATMTPKESLIKTIQGLGKEGIKARLPLLSQEDRTLLKSTLEEMAKSKSVEFDEEAKSAKVIQGNIMDTVIQEEIANDDADEKLVKPAANKQNHQGNSVEGWEGQVIKAKEMEKCGDCTPLKKCSVHMEKGNFDKLKNELSDEKGVKDPAGLAAEIGRKKMGKEAFDKKAAEGKKKMKKSSVQLIEEMNKSEELLAKAIDKMKKKGIADKDIEEKLKEKGVDKKKIEKAMKKEEAKDKLMEMEEKEHGTKDPKKLVEREKKEQDEKKMKKGEKINAEEDQLGDTDQMTEEGKDLEDATQDPAKANKKAQDDVNNTKVPEMKKSITWGDDQALLKANILGRNFTFNVGDFVETMLKAEDEMKKETKKKEDKDEEEDHEKTEKKPNPFMKKSEDLNDLIEKGMDTTWFQEDMKKSLAVQKSERSASLTKSFNETDIASLLGLTEEQAKKILG